ncbi:MAG: aldo/keto reductase [Candidatus Thorarchaeota archaeon]
MEYKTLGNTSLYVSELCLGTMVFGEEESRGADELTSNQIINRFIDVGGNFIDTADVYAQGKSEEIVGKAIEGHREELVIATKCRFPMGKTPNMRGVSRKYIFHAVDASLERLNTDYIDLLYLHGTTPNLSLNETLRALNDLVSLGKIHYIGVSNFRAWEVMKALSISEFRGWTRFEAGQYQYSLVERNIEHEFTGLFLSENISSIPWGPLGGGFLSGKYKPGEKPTEGRLAIMQDHTEEAWGRRSIDRNWKIIEIMDEIKEKEGKSYPQIALNWLLQQLAVTAPIIGVRTMDQLEDNLGAIGWELSQDELKKLDDVSKPVTEYPYRFINNYCLD